MSKRFAVIAGSGFDGLETVPHVRRPDTRFGAASAPVHRLGFGSGNVLLLRRHGDDHSLAPHVINYRANLQALCDLGAGSVIGLNTVGIITDRRSPGQLAVPSQIVDYTWGRQHSIYDGPRSGVRHIDFSEPFTPGLCTSLLEAAAEAGVDCHAGGVYAVTQGPRLETSAEIDRLATDGADYVGMTVMPEAAIARELGMAYACLALCVNHAAGRGTQSVHADIDANMATACARAVDVLRLLFARG